MKKAVFLIFFTFIFLLMFCQLNTFAEDTTLMSLPEGAKVRLGKGSINEIAYSPDGKYLAVAASIGIWLYDMKTYQEVALLTGHIGNVTSVVFSPDSNTLVSGSRDGTVRLWNIATGENHQTPIQIDWVNTVASSPDGNAFASAGGGWEGFNPGIHLWNADTGELIKTFGLRAYDTLCLVFSPDGNMLVSGNQNGDNDLYLWNAHTGELIKTFTGHTDDVNSVVFSPDGNTIVSAGAGWDDEKMEYVGGEIHLWDAHTGELLKSLTGHTESVNSVAFNPDGNRLVSGGGDGIRVWDAHTTELIKVLAVPAVSVVYSPDGSTFVSGGRDSIRVWNAHTGELLKTFTGYTGSVNSVCFSPDSNTLASGSTDNGIRVWDAHTGKPLKTLTGHTDWVDSVVFSPDGNTIASGSHDKTIRLWDSVTGKDIKTLTGHTLPVHSVAFSPDGKTIASGSSDDTIRLWAAVTGEPLKTLIGHMASAHSKVTSVVFSPDSNTLASGSQDETIRLWNGHTGEHLYTLGELPTSKWTTDWVNSVAFSPDGHTIASGNGSWTGEEGSSVGDVIHLWDTGTRQLRQTLTGHNGVVNSVAFSPDGNTVVSGATNYRNLGEEIRLWDIHTGEHLKSLTGHTDSVSSVVFSPDGKTLASGGADGTILLWDFSTPQ
jgi:WD40 repeat protein